MKLLLVLCLYIIGSVTEVNGVCPEVTGSGICVIQCITSNRVPCEDGGECCFNGCGYTCIKTNTSSTTTSRIPTTVRASTTGSSSFSTTKPSSFSTTRPSSSSTTRPSFSPSTYRTTPRIRSTTTSDKIGPCIACDGSNCQYGVKASCTECECRTNPCEVFNCPVGQWCRPVRKAGSVQIEMEPRCENGPRPNIGTRTIVSFMELIAVSLLVVLI